MGRLDETVLFDPLGLEQLAGIADRLLVELEQRAARQWLHAAPHPPAAKMLAGDKVPPYGARELPPTVSRAVEPRPLRTASLPVQPTPAPFTPPMWTPTGTLS